MKNWEKTDGNKVQYWRVSKDGFTAGEHYGSGQSDIAKNYSIEEMLDPLEVYYLTRSYLPPNTTYKQLLEELIKAILHESKSLDCSKELALIPDIEAFIADLPENNLKI